MWRSLCDTEVDLCRTGLGSRCVGNGSNAACNNWRILPDGGFNLSVSKPVDGNMVLGGCTTVMLKNIPLKCSQWDLLMIVNRVGFLGSFDYFYVPMVAKRKENRGYAFINASCHNIAYALHNGGNCNISITCINFKTYGWALFFFKVFHQSRLHIRDDQRLCVCPASLQGFDANAVRFLSSQLFGQTTGHSYGIEHKPIFFKPLHIRLDTSV